MRKTRGTEGNRKGSQLWFSQEAKLGGKDPRREKVVPRQDLTQETETPAAWPASAVPEEDTHGHRDESPQEPQTARVRARAAVPSAKSPGSESHRLRQSPFSSAPWNLCFIVSEQTTAILAQARGQHRRHRKYHMPKAGATAGDHQLRAGVEEAGADPTWSITL